MKKFIKIFAIVVGVIFLILLVIPLLFKGKIERIAREEINNQLNAEVQWSDFSLSMIKKFPSLSISVHDLSVVGEKQFEGDTLLSLNKFLISVNLASVIRGNGVEVERILLDQPVIHAKVLADSTVNWDIVKATEGLHEEADTTVEASSNFTVNLQSFVINHGIITYSDKSMLLDAGIYDLNLDMSGDLSASITDLKIKTSINHVDISMEGTRYVNGLKVSLDAEMLADMTNEVFTFKENNLMLNRLNLGFEGSVGMLEDGYDLDLKLSARETNLEAILGLVPDEFTSYTKDVQTSGNLTMETVAKGIYRDANHLPAFNMIIKVDDGKIKYPDLPKAIEDINIDFQVNNNGGLADSTLIEIKTFHFVLGQNPFDASLSVKTPMSNARFKGTMVGVIDLNSLKEAMPLDSFDIKGIIDAHINVDGDMETIEKELYDQVKVNGQVTMNGFYYDSKDLPQAVNISAALLTFTPQNIILDPFNCNIGRSDFSLKGRLENYLPYIFKDETIKGELTHYSKLLNVNEFMVAKSEGTVVAEEDTTALELMEVPKNIDLVFNSSIDKILYDKLEINQVKGKITVKDGIVKLDGIDMNLLEGQMNMTGQYNTQDAQKPYVDFFFNARNIDITQTANSFSVIDSLLPIASSSKGKIGAKFEYYSLLNQEMSPLISSITGGGNLVSKSIEVSDSEVLNKMASLLNNNKYKTMKAEDINIDFVMKDGKIIVSPFYPKVFGAKLTVQGEQGFDHSLNYVVKAPISRKELAKALSFLGSGFAESGDDLMVDVIIKGTSDNPEMSLDLSEATKQVQKEVGKEAEKVIKDVLEDENVKEAVNDFLKGLTKKKK